MLVHRTVSVQSSLEPASIAPRETKSTATSSTPSPTQDVESTMEPRPSTPTRPIVAPERRIRRRNAFYHISNAEEAPWKAPGGYYPYHDGTRTTRGKKITAKRPASPSPPSLHPPVSHQRVPNSPGEGDHSPPPQSPPSLRLPPLRISEFSSFPNPPPPQERITLPPFAAVAALSTLPILPAPTPRIRPLDREGGFCHLSWLERAPFKAPGPGIFQPPPRVPTPMPTTSPAFLSSPKRKREDVEDTLDSDEASDKKRAHRPSTD